MEAGEIRARIESAERRLLEHGDDISDTRRVVLEIKVALERLAGPVNWMQKLVFVIAVGILGVLGTAVWNVMQNRLPH